MDGMATGSVIDFNFTIAMKNTTNASVGYTINMYSLLTYIYNATDSFVYMLPFQDIGDSNEIILGQNWLSSFYTVFDNENARLGLSIANGWN